jgi:hypothetical protein
VRTVALLVVLLVAFASITAAPRSPSPPPHKPEPPIATPREPPSPSANLSASPEKSAETDNRGSEDKPVIVKVLPTPKSQEEARQERQDREDKSAADRWMVRLTAILGFIGFLQLIAFSLQARRLHQTIDEMKIATEATLSSSAGSTPRTVASL